MYKVIIIFLLLGWTGFLQAQTTLSGRVIEAETGDPIPYVNIGIKALAIGTVSNAEGRFELKLTSSDAVVTFSAIGYEAVDISAKELQTQAEIALIRKRYQMPLVKVTATQFTEDKIFGERNDKRGLSIGFGSQELGSEIGALIELGAPTLIKSANFVLNHAQGDSILFRVNIYDYQNEQIGENLLREAILIRTAQRKGLITVDLSAYDLVLDGVVLLSLEWIHDDEGKGNVGITFDTKKGKSLKGVYVKHTSLSDFNKLDYKKNLKPCFYLVGKQ